MIGFEVIFGLDILLHFVAHQKPEYEESSISLGSIASNYIMRGSFLFDMLAIVPLNYFINNNLFIYFFKAMRILKSRILFDQKGFMI